MDNDALTQEELDAQQGEELPDREAMSVITMPGEPIDSIGLPVEPPDSV